MNEATLNRKSAEKMLAAVLAVRAKSWNVDGAVDLIGEVAPEAWINDEGYIVISLEGEHGYLFGDYYGEFRGGCPWVKPALEALAEEHGCYWEWQNPGLITLVN